MPVRWPMWTKHRGSLCVIQCPIGETALALEPVRDEDGVERMTPVVREGCVGCGVCEMICAQEPACIVVDERAAWEPT